MSEGTPPPPADNSAASSQHPEGSTPPPPPPAPPPTAPYGSPYGAPGTASGNGDLLTRFLARLIDYVLLGIVGYVINRLLVASLFDVSTATTLGGAAGVAVGYLVVSSIITTILYLGYFGLLESSQGRTVGKMVMKLRVQTLEGQNPTLTQAIKRNIWLGLPILGVIPILGGLLAALGQLVAAILIAVQINSDPERRPWTDKLADTRVLKENA